jgi:uncharacterized protein DUF4136
MTPDLARTFMTRVAIVCVVLNVAMALLVGQTVKYGVTVKSDRKTDFTLIKSYSWENGSPSLDKDVNQQIVDAIDHELMSLGLEKRPSAPSDVTVSYGSLQRTGVDVKAKPTGQDATRPQYPVGSLNVVMREPGTRKELFRGRVDKPIDLDRAKLHQAIDEVVAEIFAKYPTRKQK